MLGVARLAHRAFAPCGWVVPVGSRGRISGGRAQRIVRVARELHLQIPDPLLGRRERRLQGRYERAELGVLSLQLNNPIVSRVPCHDEALVVVLRVRLVDGISLRLDDAFALVTGPGHGRDGRPIARLRVPEGSGASRVPSPEARRLRRPRPALRAPAALSWGRWADGASGGGFGHRIVMAIDHVCDLSSSLSE
jgi:hypothetical protein